ncbi:MAG TPA: hypothetical protein EYG97_01275 [Arcobacter sp.]|nr:hypothetical protein [Arcobacter sp.]HIP55636.1 hypothetical protein [Arcobacter sp.]
MNLEIIKSINKQKAINALNTICENINILEKRDKQNTSLDLENILKQTQTYLVTLNIQELNLQEIDEILSFVEVTHIKIMEAV